MNDTQVDATPSSLARSGRRRMPDRLLEGRWTTHYSASWSERMADIESRGARRPLESEENKSA